MPVSTTIVEAKQILEVQKRDGMHCPVCEQYAKLYPRSLTSAMAYGLILLANNTADFVHVERFFKDIDGIPSSIRGDISKLVYWDFLERKIADRDDGSNRNGYYKVTSAGREFVANRLRVSKKVLLYNNESYGFEGQLIDIEDALGTKFNYSELMNE